MKTLEEKIEKLKQETALEESLKQVFPDLHLYSSLTEDYMVKKYGYKYRVWGELDKDGFNKLLNHFKPTRDSFTTGQNDIFIDSPFRIVIDNPPAYKRIVSIEWVSNDYCVMVKLPESMLSHFFNKTTRGVTDSEYHYFTGSSYAELRRMQLMKMTFKKDHINWYGGSCTAKDPEEIMAIINFLKE